MLFSIITPTIGNDKLKAVLTSINRQIYNNIEHLIVIDGEKYWEKVDKILEEVKPHENIKRYVFKFPYSTGKDNYYGHKIFASISQIVNGNYVIFLDDDNTIQPDHVKNYYDLINKEKYEWLYSLRNIVDKDDNFICVDGCESLGYISNIFYNLKYFLSESGYPGLTDFQDCYL